VEVSGSEIAMTFGDRRYRVRGLSKNQSFDLLKVNVLVCFGELFHVDTLDKNPTRDDFTPEDFERMRHGEAPRRYNPDKGGIESMERSHEPIPLREGGTETVPRWPQEHGAVDPHRHPGY
jgi:hypothetical protein